MKEELKVIISAEIDKLKQNINSAKQQINSFSNEVKNQSKNVDATFQKMGDGIAAGMKAAAVGTGAVITAIAGITTASVKAYADYEQLTGGVNKLFGDSAKTIMSYADGAYKTAGVSANQYMNQIMGFSASLISSLGGDTKAAAEIGNMAVQDMSDNAATFGSNIVDLQNAYQGFAKQNYSMLDNLKLGYGGSATEMARLVNESGILGDAFIDLADKQNIGAALQEVGFAKIIQAINLTQQRMKITGTTMAEAEHTISGSITMVKASWENLMIGLAQDEADIPTLVGNVVSSAAQVLENIIPVVKQVLANIPAAIAEVSPEAGKAAQVIIDTLGKAFELLLPIIKDVGGVILDVMSYLTEHTGVLIAVGSAIGIIVSAITMYNTVQAIKNALDLTGTITVGGLTKALAAHVVAMAAAIAPYLAVAAAIAALIAGIVLLVKNWDTITAKVKEVAEKVVNFVSGMVSSVVGWFGDLKDKVVSKAQEIKNNVSQKWQEMKDAVERKTQEMKDKAVQLWGVIKEKTSKAAADAKDAAVKNLDKMKQAYQEKGGGIQGIVAATMTGIKGAYNTAFTFIDSLTGGKLGNILNKFKSIFETIKSVVKSGLDKVKGFFSGLKIELPKIKLPHFSISGKFSINPLEVPKLSVDWYQRGGVFDKPTLFGYGGSIGGLGENGAEAVVPLEKNTQWLDKIAERLAAKQGSTPIVLTVDGKVFAETSINSINQLTKQTGSLALNLF